MYGMHGMYGMSRKYAMYGMYVFSYISYYPCLLVQATNTHQKKLQFVHGV